MKLKVAGKTILVAAFLVAGAGVHISGSADMERVSVEPASARDLYINNCARCHGADGKGNTRLGRELDVSDLTSRKVQRMSRKKMSRVIRYGEDSMPAFRNKLSRKEINKIVSYVKRLD